MRLGYASTDTSTGWPTFMRGASDSRTLAISHTVSRLPTVNTGSVAPTLMYWPRPTLRWMTVPEIGAFTIASAPILSTFSSRSISASERPRMRRRLRTAASAISAERKSPCAPIRSDCACSRSFSAPPRMASSSRWRFSTVLARSTLDFDFSTPATAVTRSFWPCTNSLASTANSGAPASTWSPGLAIRRLTRPEYGENTGVVVSSLSAILPSVARSSRNAT